MQLLHFDQGGQPGPSELLRATGARPEVVTALEDVGMPAGHYLNTPTHMEPQSIFL